MVTPWALEHRHPRYANPVSCLLHEFLLPKEAKQLTNNQRFEAKHKARGTDFRGSNPDKDSTRRHRTSPQTALQDHYESGR